MIPMPAGYSGTPLIQKLGIAPTSKVALIGAPPGVLEVPTAPRAPFDVIVCFVTKRAELAKHIAAQRPRLAQDGGLWIAWPKASSGVPTEVNENTVRELALPTGLVDNKVCAIDATWSGLRLVIRRELRTPARTPRRASARSTGR
jgi:hypothetical protein